MEGGGLPQPRADLLVEAVALGGGVAEDGDADGVPAERAEFPATSSTFSSCGGSTSLRVQAASEMERVAEVNTVGGFLPGRSGEF